MILNYYFKNEYFRHLSTKNVIGLGFICCQIGVYKHKKYLTGWDTKIGTASLKKFLVLLPVNDNGFVASRLQELCKL